VTTNRARARARAYRSTLIARDAASRWEEVACSRDPAVREKKEKEKKKKKRERKEKEVEHYFGASRFDARRTSSRIIDSRGISSGARSKVADRPLNNAK